MGETLLASALAALMDALSLISDVEREDGIGEPSVADVLMTLGENAVFSKAASTLTAAGYPATLVNTVLGAFAGGVTLGSMFLIPTIKMSLTEANAWSEGIKHLGPEERKVFRAMRATEKELGRRSKDAWEEFQYWNDDWDGIVGHNAASEAKADHYRDLHQYLSQARRGLRKKMRGMRRFDSD